METILFSSWAGEIVDNRGKQPENFLPVSAMDLPHFFQSGEKIQACIGWNGLVVRNENVNILNLCHEHLRFLQHHSCGKCFPCREGLEIMLFLLERISEGKGCKKDIEDLRRLGNIIVQSSKCGIGQTGPVPVLDALRYFETVFLDAIQTGITQEKDVTTYHSTLTAPCMEACPMHIDIPSYVESIAEGCFEKSLEIIKTKLPLPGVLGRVCVRPCETHCRRGLMDGPVSIKHLKRFVADYEISRNKKNDYAPESSSIIGNVAIVGAGPAGVTCAYHLALKGHKVTVYEALEEPGGMAAVGIPDYRLPRHILRDEIERIQKMGVTLHYGVRVGKDIMLGDLERNYDTVFIAIGAHLSLPMGLSGEDKGYEGFISGVQYLKDINEGRDPYPEGKTVVVIGGGNVALDCVRTSFRVNKTKVNLIYRRTKKEMPADPEEIRAAEEEGVNFLYLTHPVQILAEQGRVVGLECIKTELSEPDSSGRRRPVSVSGSEFTIACDIVVPAIGQAIDLSLLQGNTEIQTTRWNSIEVNPVTNQTNAPGIFSGGDCATGIGALIAACAAGRTAALQMDRYLRQLPPLASHGDNFNMFLRKIGVFDHKESTEIPGGCPGQHLSMLDPKKRKHTFDEVEQGFSVQEAMDEARRCLRCYRAVTLAVAIEEPHSSELK